MTAQQQNDLVIFVGLYGCFCVLALLFVGYQIRKHWFRDDNGNLIGKDKKNGTD